MWDVIVLIPDHCLSIYFEKLVIAFLSFSRFFLFLCLSFDGDQIYYPQ